MRPKRCKLCGCIMYDDNGSEICDCCLDDMAESEEDAEEDNGE